MAEIPVGEGKSRVITAGTVLEAQNRLERSASTGVPPSLHRKLSEVMGAIEWQPKTGRNQQQGYDFVSVERIKDAVREQLALRKVMVYTAITQVHRDELATKSGGTLHHVTVQGLVTFADGESGEMFTIEAAGEAMDSGDKALNKAQTALVKYALINTFLIPTGDDPDQQTAEPASRRRPAAERTDTRGSSPAKAEAPIPVAANPKVQCESKSPFGTDDNPIQCRKEMGHEGVHRTPDQSWPQ